MASLASLEHFQQSSCFKTPINAIYQHRFLVKEQNKNGVYRRVDDVGSTPPPSRGKPTAADRCHWLALLAQLAFPLRVRNCCHVPVPAIERSPVLTDRYMKIYSFDGDKMAAVVFGQLHAGRCFACRPPV